jgi:hypothetical protein
MLEPFDNPAHYQQAVNRLHRIGQTRAVTVKMVMIAGTIEENIWQVSVAIAPQSYHFDNKNFELLTTVV